MSRELEELDRRLRSGRAIAVAHRSPRDKDASGIGMTVALLYHLNSYLVSVETFRDDGGYGEKLLRTERSFDSLEAALEEIAQHGFRIDQLKVQPEPP